MLKILQLAFFLAFLWSCYLKRTSVDLSSFMLVSAIQIIKGVDNSQVAGIQVRTCTWELAPRFGEQPSDLISFLVSIIPLFGSCRVNQILCGKERVQTCKLCTCNALSNLKNMSMFLHSWLLTIWCQEAFERIQKNFWSKFFTAGKQTHKVKEIKLSVYGYETPFSDQHWWS